MLLKNLLPGTHKSEPQSLTKPFDYSLDGFRKEMEKTFDHFFSNSLWKDTENAFMPSVNISEDDKNYHLSVEVPGMEKDDIHLEIVDNRLIISGEKKEEKEVKENNYHRTESTYGKFQRSFFLDEGCDQNSIEAAMKNGILKINIKKLPATESNRKKVPILS